MKPEELRQIHVDGRTFHFSYHSSGTKKPLLVVLHGHNKTPRPSKLKSEHFNVLCPIDNFGLEGWGSWFLGEDGDFFWLKAMKCLISHVYAGDEIYFIGSSMGGYGAILHGTLNNAIGVYANIPQTRLLGSTYAIQRTRPYFSKIFGNNTDAIYNDLKNIVIAGTPTHFDITSIRWDKEHYLQEQAIDFVSHLTRNNISFSFEVFPQEGHGLVIPLHEAAERLLNRVKATEPLRTRFGIAHSKNEVEPARKKGNADEIALELQQHPTNRITVIERSQQKRGALYSYIDPAEFGITETSRVCIYDRAKKEYTHLLKLKENEIVQFSEQDCRSSVTYRIDQWENNKWAIKIDHSPLLSAEMLGSIENTPIHRLRGQGFTIRQNVTISPYRHLNRSNAPFGVSSVYSHGQFIPESLRFTLREQADAPGMVAPHEELHRGTVIFAGLQNGSFGHYITESVARLWYAAENPNIPIVWSSAGPLSDVQLAVLNLLKIRNSHIFITRPTLFEEVVFPLPGLILGNYLNTDHANFLGAYSSEQIGCKDTPFARDKLFLSRSSLPGVRGKSELDLSLETTLVEAGFRVFYPEQHTLVEQLMAIANARIVVGVEGSAMHLPLLMKDPVRTKFIAIARHRRGSGVFEHIRNIKALDYTTYDFSDDPTSRRLARDPPALNITTFRHAVKVTGGFEDHFDLIEDHKCRPIFKMNDFEYFMKRSRVKCFPDEQPLISTPSHKKNTFGTADD